MVTQSRIEPYKLIILKGTAIKGFMMVIGNSSKVNYYYIIFTERRFFNTLH